MNSDFIHIEIDGQLIEYTDFYPIDECLCGIQIGFIHGEDEATRPGDEVRSYKISENKLSVLNIYNKENKFGLKGIFRFGKWEYAEDGIPLFSVWERII